MLAASYSILLICYGNRVNLTNNQRNQTHKVFADIDSVIPNVNNKRKRMISTKFIIKQIFMLLGLPSECIKITKSKKTHGFYNRYWENVQLLIGDRIQSIINM